MLLVQIVFILVGLLFVIFLTFGLIIRLFGGILILIRCFLSCFSDNLLLWLTDICLDTLLLGLLFDVVIEHLNLLQLMPGFYNIIMDLQMLLGLLSPSTFASGLVLLTLCLNLFHSLFDTVRSFIFLIFLLIEDFFIWIIRAWTV